MKESGIRWTGIGMALALAFGLAACGGDANGSDAAEQLNEAAAAAGEMVGDAAEGLSDDAAAAMEQELPEGVTQETIARGKAVYAGAGICSSCHGPAGQGVPSLGAPLTDGEWLHSDGSYEGIVKTVMSGVTAQKSSSGVPMPAKGGTNISDDDVKAVAAYVWSLGHGGK